MTIGCVSRRGPWEACDELCMCGCVHSAAYNRFALLPMSIIVVVQLFLKYPPFHQGHPIYFMFKWLLGLWLISIWIIGCLLASWFGHIWNWTHFVIVTISVSYTWTDIVAWTLWNHCSHCYVYSDANYMSSWAFTDYNIFGSQKTQFVMKNHVSELSTALWDRS